MAQDELQGHEFEQWLRRAIWRNIIDFMEAPLRPVEGRLCQLDLLALRKLAEAERNPDQAVALRPGGLACFQRLHQHGIIARKTEGPRVWYLMTPLAHEVLRANVSFRAPVEKEN